MKSTLIKDTTKEERIALIKSWIPDDDGMEDCGIDLWDMFDDYIKGKREIAEINASFHADYMMADEEASKEPTPEKSAEQMAADAASARRRRGGAGVR